MATGTVTGYTSARMKNIEDTTVVDGEVVGDDLHLLQRDGTVINAGNVRGPQGNALSAWPVGSIFIAAVATSPATLLGGGTWARFGQGRVLVSQDGTQTEFDTVEETGGAKTHTLTSGEMPAHTHGPGTLATASAGDHTHSVLRGEDLGAATNRVVQSNTTVPAEGDGTSGTAGAHTHTLSGATASSGSGGAHNNLQPYIVVYMWKRTA